MLKYGVGDLRAFFENDARFLQRLARPGAVVSGKVTFSDGEQAEWYLDQSGRLAVIARQQGYKPPASDVQQFQLALEREMAKLGF